MPYGCIGWLAITVLSMKIDRVHGMSDNEVLMLEQPFTT